MTAEPIHGVVVVDKPGGVTSFAIVRQARHVTGARKVGHGGTLDPMATGVLPICFGEATKLAQFLLDADKEYEATIALGAATDTYDADGVITGRQPAHGLVASDVEGALTGFLGEQKQIPPMFSALKREGRPLYEYARAGQTVDRVARTIRIHQIELRGFTPAAGHTSGTEFDLARARVFIRCSKGTYVRSLAHDLGHMLGTGAHLAALRRVRSGPFGLEHAINPEDIGAVSLPVVSLADALCHLGSVDVTDEVARLVTQGKPVPWAQTIVPGAGPVRILGPGGVLVAVAHRGEPSEAIRTLRVFRQFQGA